MNPNLCISVSMSTRSGASYRGLPLFRLHRQSFPFAAPGLLALGSSLVYSYRTVAEYPTPTRRTVNRGVRKTYNYLTTERLVPVKRVKLSRKLLRIRDDKILAIRNNYKQKLLQDIETKIHYLKPEIKQLVFFPPVRNRLNTKRLFRGNRSFSPSTFMQIFFDITKTVTSGSHREKLINLMREVGISPLPSDDVWRRYTDPQTGDINVGLLYSRYMERYLIRICEKYTPNTSLQCKRMFPIQAYILKNFSDTSKVPSLREWSESVGSLRKEELVLRARPQDTLSISLDQANLELRIYGRKQIESTVSSMGFEEQQNLINYVIEHEVEFFEKMRSHLLFAAQVMLAINSIPDVKAIQKPGSVFLFDKKMRLVIQQNGSWFPDIPKSIKEYRQLSSEEQKKYYCFNTHIGQHTTSGAQLYLRYCSRDYGIGRSESVHRFLNLTDLQQAALNFPFYYPITPKNAASVAFRKFYVDMCVRLGFGNKITHHTIGNRYLESSMRTKWKLLDPAEREKYFEPDITGLTFPLQPASSNEVGGAASCEEDSREPGVPPQIVRSASEEGTTCAVGTMEPTPSSDEHSPHQPQEEGLYQSDLDNSVETGGENKPLDPPMPMRVDRKKSETSRKAKASELRISVTDPHRIQETEMMSRMVIV